MKGRLITWTICLVVLVWYVGLWASVCGVAPGPWWLWCAPFYVVVLLALWWRLVEWREVRRAERRRRLARAENLAFLRGVDSRKLMDEWLRERTPQARPPDQPVLIRNLSNRTVHLHVSPRPPDPQP